jgi:hypothetical protein
VIVRDEPPPSSRRPSLFRSPALLRALNIAAVALSLAGVTGALMGRILGGSREFAVVALSCSLPTLVFGLAWARLLRSRAKHAWGYRVADFEEELLALDEEGEPVVAPRL